MKVNNTSLPAIHDLYYPDTRSEEYKKFNALPGAENLLLNSFVLLRKQVEDSLQYQTLAEKMRKLNSPIYGETIKNILPQSGQAIFLDSVQDFQNMEKTPEEIELALTEKRMEDLPQIKGILTVTNEHCNGHFDNFPVMPGHKMLEFANQVAIIFGEKIPELVEDRQLKVFLAGCDKVRYANPASPGDTLIADVKLIKKNIGKTKGFVFFQCTITNQENKKICTIGEIVGALKREKPPTE